MKKLNKKHGGSRTGAGRKIQSLKITHRESMLITDALNGIIINRDNAAVHLPIEIEDALSHNNNLAEKWDVDTAALLKKLKNLSHNAAVEITDSVSKFWSQTVSPPKSRSKPVRMKALGGTKPPTAK